MHRPKGKLEQMYFNRCMRQRRLEAVKNTAEADKAIEAGYKTIKLMAIAATGYALWVAWDLLP